MTYQLTERDKEWIQDAMERDLTRLQIKKKLSDANFKPDRIDAFIDYYDIEKDKQLKGESTDLPNEPDFEMNVRKYKDKETRKELSWKERREVKRFLRETDKYVKILKVATDNFKKELEYFSKQDWTKGKIDEEMKFLKDEIIDRIIEAKIIVDIPHPRTGEEVTKDNLKSLEIDELIALIEENVKTLDLIVNGKITQ